MNSNAVLSKDDIKIIYEQLEIQPSELEDSFDSEYYNFWDFGKDPDESQVVVGLSADISLL